MMAMLRILFIDGRLSEQEGAAKCTRDNVRVKRSDAPAVQPLGKILQPLTWCSIRVCDAAGNLIDAEKMVNDRNNPKGHAVAI